MSEQQELGQIIRNELFMFSEWLDVQKLMKTPRQSRDDRTHEELIRDYVKSGRSERARWHAE